MSLDTDWIDELLSDTREGVMALLDEPSIEPDLDALACTVLAHRDAVHENARPLTDLDLADLLTEATLGLLRRAAAGPVELKRLASVAARYFVERTDDLGSAFAFDDDIEVFNAIAARVAPELILGL